jgi:hypothetical protein
LADGAVDVSADKDRARLFKQTVNSEENKELRSNKDAKRREQQRECLVHKKRASAEEEQGGAFQSLRMSLLLSKKTFFQHHQPFQMMKTRT